MTDLYVQDLLGDYVPAHGELILAEARRRLAAKYRRGAALTEPDAVREALQWRLAERPYEVFGCLWLDNRHRVIEFAELFKGTIDAAAVYPREVVKAALAHNSAAVVFVHNHPSGVAEPSDADRLLTVKLKAALALVDVKTLDHFVVAAEGSYSFAEHGLL